MSRRPSRILVVDDDPAAQHETVKLLERRDYAVVCAWSIPDAYARLAGLPFDLIVAGSRVGGGSGLDFVLACRRGRPETSAIIVAGGPGEVPEDVAWASGVPTVYRPLHPEHFLMLVAERIASVPRRQRWLRKRVQSYIPLQVGHARARLLDVSYGGLSFELEGESFELPSPVQINIPDSQLCVRAELVWSVRSSDGASCICGVMLSGPTPAPAWREFVDFVA
jgi:DNA-binding response OmpR family regulator